MYHPVLAKANILEELQQLVRQAKDRGGCTGRDSVDLEVLVRDALTHGMLAGDSIWRQAAELVEASEEDVPDCYLEQIEESDDSLRVVIEVWLALRHQQGQLSVTLKTLGQDKARIEQYYDEWALMRVPGDLKCLVSLVEEFEGLAPLPFASDDQYPHMLFSKNNVVLDLAPHTGADPQRSGYFCICCSQPLEDLEARVDGGPVGVRLLWTPNEHYAKCLNNEKPLPPGWDEGYDPVTGHRYYIHHDSKTTTWTDPRTTSQDEQSDEDRSNDRPQSLWHDLPVECACRIVGSVPGATRHPCSIFIDVALEEIVHMKQNITSTENGAGYIEFQPEMTHSTLRMYREPLRFRFVRGMMSLSDVVAKYTFVNIDDSADEILRRSSYRPSAPDLNRRRRRRAQTFTDIRQKKASFIWPEHVTEVNGAIQASGLHAFQDSEGRIVDWHGLRKAIFFRGIHSDLRSLVWKFFLGFFSEDSTAEERDVVKLEKRNQYWAIRRQWMSLSVEESTHLHKLTREISKDVVRTDRDCSFYQGFRNPNLDVLLNILITYAEYRPETGYSQGISDLLSPLLAVMADEAEAFWCLDALMERMSGNFGAQGTEMHNKLDMTRLLVQVLNPTLYAYLSDRDVLNMFHCYRWLLLDFKREFHIFDVMRIWDVLWTQHRTDHMNLFVAVAILDLTADKLMATNRRSDEILEFFNQLAMNMNVQEVLAHARSLLYRFAACEAPSELDVLCKSTLFSADSSAEDGDEVLNELAAAKQKAFEAVVDRVATATVEDIVVKSVEQCLRSGGGLPSDPSLVTQVSEEDLTPAPTDPQGSVLPRVELTADVKAVLYVRLAIQHDENQSYNKAIDNYLVAIDALLSQASNPETPPGSQRKLRQHANELLARAEYLKAAMTADETETQ